MNMLPSLNTCAHIETNAFVLLQQLAIPHAYACASEDGSKVAIISRSNGISLQTGSAPYTDAALLVKSGWATWERGKTSGRNRLALTESGRALAKHHTNLGIDTHLEIAPQQLDATLDKKKQLDFKESTIHVLYPTTNINVTQSIPRKRSQNLHSADILPFRVYRFPNKQRITRSAIEA